MMCYILIFSMLFQGKKFEIKNKTATFQTDFILLESKKKIIKISQYYQCITS